MAVAKLCSIMASKFKYVCCVSIPLVAIDTKLRMHDVGQVQCEELVLRMAIEQSCVLQWRLSSSMCVVSASLLLRLTLMGQCSTVIADYRCLL